MKKITIAIDGYSSCGKSTLAKDLAKALDYLYIDSGAMYRAVTHYFIQNNIELNDDEAVKDALDHINIRFQKDNGSMQTLLNEVNVEQVIRGMAVSRLVSPVAALTRVRTFLVKQQQALGSQKGIVMDGRDIGTVVFPKAELKIFLTAKTNIRVHRRYEELKAKGMVVDSESIQQNLLERDHIDSTREDSPLMQAEDAVLIDNSNLNKEEQMSILLILARLRMK